MTPDDANVVINRVKGIFSSNIPGRIEIWTDLGIVIGGQ